MISVFAGVGIVSAVIGLWLAWALRRSGWLLSGVTAVGVPAASVAVYLLMGQPALMDLPLAARTEPAVVEIRGQNQYRELTGRLAEHLQENPENLEGWTLLSRAYRNLGEWNFAIEAWRRALLLKGETASAQDWAQMAALLVQNAEGQVTPVAEEMARRAVGIDPDEPEARHLLALAKAQKGDLAGAVQDWEEILAKAPPGAEWRPAIAQYLATARARMAAPKTGPSSEEVAAAAAMNPDERAAMIEGMVEGLAARLEDQPDDPQGWLRLARAYGVLGRKDDARSALNQAEERAEARLKTGAAEPAPMQAVLAAAAAMRQEFGL